MADLKPYSRGEYGRALLVNAATEPFNALIFAGVLIAGFALGQVALLAAIGVVLYALAVARTFFDKAEAEKVLAAERTRRGGKRAPRLDASTLAPPIAERVHAARERQARIAEAIKRADLPYEEVSSEVDAFVHAMDQTANRAELLYEALAETPVAEVQRRLAGLSGAEDPGKAQLRDALRQQLTVLERMETQLQRFYDEMDRMTVELDTIRGNLVSVSATTEADSQRRLAEEVRGLRDELGAVAAGIDEAYKD
jgi:archaellum component FlaC